MDGSDLKIERIKRGWYCPVMPAKVSRASGRGQEKCCGIEQGFGKHGRSYAGEKVLQVGRQPAAGRGGDKRMSR